MNHRGEDKRESRVKVDNSSTISRVLVTCRLTVGAVNCRRMASGVSGRILSLGDGLLSA